MKGQWWMASLGALALAFSQAASAAAQQQVTYTRAEYDAYQACAAEQNMQQRVRCLDDFKARFPQSTLMPFILQAYVQAHFALQNYVKAVEAADMLLSTPNLDVPSRLNATVLRAQAFYLGFSRQQITAPADLTKARTSAKEGLSLLEQWTKPEGVTDEQYAQQKKGFQVLFNSIAGIAAFQLKDYPDAKGYIRASLALEPNDALNYYRLGVSLLQQKPAEYLEGFWALARAIAMKPPGEAQIRTYLRRQVATYQGTGCEHLLDAQINELLALAGGASERPANYNIPSADDLQKVRERTTDVLAALRAGGENGKLVFLATCGAEFPEVAGKVIEVGEGNDSVILKVATGSTPEEIEAATTANMEVKVVGQPEAKRLEKDLPVRFTATLVGYGPEPFLLKWDKAKVNPEDIPPEKPQAGKAPAKQPTKRPPPKRPPAR